MNLRTKSREAETADEDMPRVKRLPIRLAISDDNLENKIRRAFELAKSSGHELDLTFITQSA
jgi:hypothetical protein